MPPRTIDLARLKSLIEVEQVTQARAAAILGCSTSCIERNVARLGLTTQRSGPRSGPGHPDWKGGRILVGRYWYRWTNSHPLRTQGNYVLEHRLVVEAALGRYLTRDEVVHHKNGDPQDNRVENLVVFATNGAHLRHELTGRAVPYQSAEWRDSVKAGIRKSRSARLQESLESGG
jgi:HNH endonuclease